MGIREDVFYEGGPHRGDLILGVLMAFTLVGLPIAIAAVVRALWLRYRITSRRISIVGGWMGRDRSDVIYLEVAKVTSVPRGLGSWGDMVVTLQDGSKLEMRSVPNFRKVCDYINEKIESVSRPAAPVSNR